MGQVQPATQCQDECLPLTDAVEELRQLLKTHCDLLRSVENKHVCASFVHKSHEEHVDKGEGQRESGARMRASIASLLSKICVINTSSVVHGHVRM